MTLKTSEEAAARSLLSAKAVRERAHEMLKIGLADGLAEWRIDLGRLPATADLVAEVIRANYPSLEVPFHARWRHFVVGGRNLWAELARKAAWRDPADKARAAFDLAIVSVLLDAGAGPAWRYVDTATGVTSNRSEGLAVASLRLFEEGVLSAHDDPYRVDRLTKVTGELLGKVFQVSDDNPMVGLEGRAGLLRRLDAQMLARPDLFAMEGSPRPGGLFDAMVVRSVDGQLQAPIILEVLLEALGPIWEGRLTLGGLPLGDCWRHPAIQRDDATNGLVPLHKLSQWLSYSLIEPLQEAGIEVVDIDGLTGLAEYRNGGLFVDDGVLIARDPAQLARPQAVSDPLVVGWRSLTVALLDQIAPLVRERLGVRAEDFPLARVLEGGTWSAGRRLARERRADSGPPFTILSDGTVF